MNLRELQKTVKECEYLSDDELVEYIANHENQDKKFWLMVVMNLHKSPDTQGEYDV